MENRTRILLIILAVLAVAAAGFYSYGRFFGGKEGQAPQQITTAKPPAAVVPAQPHAGQPAGQPSAASSQNPANAAVTVPQPAQAQGNPMPPQPAAVPGPQPGRGAVPAAATASAVSKAPQPAPAAAASAAATAPQPSPAAAKPGAAKADPPVIRVFEKGKEVRYASAEEFIKKTSMKPEEVKVFSRKYLDDSTKARDVAKAKKDKSALEAAEAQVKLAESLAGAVANLKDEKSQDSGKKVYAYVSLNKRDPFMNPMQIPKVYPLVMPNAKPYERFPIEQLLVKGILWNRKGYRAMIVTPDGRAFTLKTGDVLGDKRGRVTRITEKRVYVTEKIPDILGEIEIKNTILQLHKEAE